MNTIQVSLQVQRMKPMPSTITPGQQTAVWTDHSKFGPCPFGNFRSATSVQGNTTSPLICSSSKVHHIAPCVHFTQETSQNIMTVFFTNLMHKFFILIHLLYSSTCFEHYYAHLQEDNCISTSSGIVTLFR